jgi:hypothetical protein
MAKKAGSSQNEYHLLTAKGEKNREQSEWVSPSDSRR